MKTTLSKLGFIGLDHLGVFVSDLERARVFYENVLGMQFVEDFEDDSVWMVTMRSLDHEIHLFKPKDPSKSPHINHVSYRIDPGDFETFMAQLKERGIQYSGPHVYQNTQFIKFQDPDGLIWECICLVDGEGT